MRAFAFSHSINTPTKEVKSKCQVQEAITVINY